MTTAVHETPRIVDVQLIPLEQLLESAMNVRRHYSATAMAELEASLRQVGVLTPLIARPYLSASDAVGQLYELAAGHRRYRAAQAIGLTAVPVRVMSLDDEAFRNVLIIENLQRQDIHPLDEADGYQALLKADKAYTVEAIAAKVGKSPSYIYQRLKLTNLTAEVRTAWDADEITPAHAIRLARLTPAQQKDALEQCWHPLFGRDENGPKREPAPLSNLDRWIEKHVKVETAAPETPYYFPEIAEQIAAQEEPEKLLQLSESHMPGADLGTKQHGILGHGRWTRITGPKNRCANVEKGVVVHGGPMRILEVCATKGCPKHFPARKKAKTSTSAARQDNHQDRWKRDEEERNRKAAAWDAILPRVQERLLTAILESGPKGRVLEHAVAGVRDRVRRQEHALFDRLVGKVTAENFLVATVAADALDGLWNIEHAKAAAKPLGIDLKAFEAEYRKALAPPKAEKKPEAAKGKKPATKKGRLG